MCPGYAHGMNEFMSSNDPVASLAPEDPTDPYLWLEDVTGDDALDWVRRHNEPTLADLGDDEFEVMRAEALEVLDTDARIPYVRRRGEYLYNFWRDETHPRGLWRRTSLESYRTDSPEWDVVIDVDALAAADDENWVWAGADVIEPDHTLALISLSRGGADAVVVREFDMRTREFVVGGFELPEAKTQITWADENTVLLGTDFGADSLTESGYARLVKRWRRGQPLADAVTVYAGERSDVIVAASVDRTPGYERTMISRAVDFFNDEVYELRGEELLRIDAPTDATVSVHHDWLLIELRTDWDGHAAGSLLASSYADFMSGDRNLVTVFRPDEGTSLHQYSWTRDALVIVTLADVVSRVQIVTPGAWTTTDLPGVPPNSNTVIAAADSYGDEIFLDSSGFVTPSQLLHGTPDGPVSPIKAAPGFFDTTGIEVSQHFATSADGTRIPYFTVGRPGSTGPTLLGGYGGFEVSRRAGPAVAGPRRHLCAGQHPRRRRVRAGLAHPGDARGSAPRRRGFRRSGKGSGDARGDHGGPAGRSGRQQRRPADGDHADPLSGPVRRVGVQRAAAGHEAVPPAAGGGVLGGRVRQPR